MAGWPQTRSKGTERAGWTYVVEEAQVTVKRADSVQYKSLHSAHPSSPDPGFGFVRARCCCVTSLRFRTAAVRSSCILNAWGLGFRTGCDVRLAGLEMRCHVWSMHSDEPGPPHEVSVYIRNVGLKLHFLNLSTDIEIWPSFCQHPKAWSCVKWRFIHTPHSLAYLKVIPSVGLPVLSLRFSLWVSVAWEVGIYAPNLGL